MSLTTRIIIPLLLSALVYYRWPVLRTFYTNAPSRLQKHNDLHNFEILFRPVVRNCEDILLHEAEGWALMSCDPGRDLWNTVMGTFVNHSTPAGTGLYLYDYAKTPETPPRKLVITGGPAGYEDDFHPLGIDYHAASQTVMLINHASRGSSVDLFNLDIDATTLSLRISITGRQIRTPNSIAALSETEMFLTNDHFFEARYHPILAKLETYLALHGGNVIYVKLGKNGSTGMHILARIPFANGIAMLNSSTLAVASSATAAIRIYTILDSSKQDPSIPELKWSTTIALPFLPDNLSVDSQGKLLIAGHPHASTIEKVAKTNRFCEFDGSHEGHCHRTRLSWLAQWAGHDGLQTLYVGDDFGTSTTAVRDCSRAVGLATGLYERGVLTWRF